MNKRVATGHRLFVEAAKFEGHSKSQIENVEMSFYTGAALIVGLMTKARPGDRNALLKELRAEMAQFQFELAGKAVALALKRIGDEK